MDARQDLWQDVGALADLPENVPVTVRAGTQQVLLVRRGARVHATEPLCPHKFTALEDGTVEGDCLRCPMHDAAFHLENGRPRAGDEWAGVLGTFPCRVHEGRVLVALG